MYGVPLQEDGISHMANPAHFFFNDLSPSDAEPWVEALDDTYYLGRGPVISRSQLLISESYQPQCNRDSRSEELKTASRHYITS